MDLAGIIMLSILALWVGSAISSHAWHFVKFKMMKKWTDKSFDTHSGDAHAP